MRTAYMTEDVVPPEPVDYLSWYKNTYIPWYQEWEKKKRSFEQKMMIYEASKFRQGIPSNPFGQVSFGNPFPFYSKASYVQYLNGRVQGGSSPQSTYVTQYKAWREQQEKAKCEKNSNVTNLAELIECSADADCRIRVLGQGCWISSTDTDEGECGIVTQVSVLRNQAQVITRARLYCNGPTRGTVRLDLT